MARSRIESISLSLNKITPEIGSTLATWRPPALVARLRYDKVIRKWDILSDIRTFVGLKDILSDIRTFLSDIRTISPNGSFWPAVGYGR